MELSNVFSQETGDKFLTQWIVRYADSILLLAKSLCDAVIKIVFQKLKDGRDGKYFEISFGLHICKLHHCKPDIASAEQAILILFFRRGGGKVKITAQLVSNQLIILTSYC